MIPGESSRTVTYIKKKEIEIDRYTERERDAARKENPEKNT